jgi:hypothetical protein
MSKHSRLCLGIKSGVVQCLVFFPCTMAHYQLTSVDEPVRRGEAKVDSRGRAWMENPIGSITRHKRRV